MLVAEYAIPTLDKGNHTKQHRHIQAKGAGEYAQYVIVCINKEYITFS